MSSKLSISPNNSRKGVAFRIALFPCGVQYRLAKATSKKHASRYYASWLGRWTAVDPAGLVDGVNLYMYCRGNPVKFLDRDGRQANPFALINQFKKEIRHIADAVTKNPVTRAVLNFIGPDIHSEPTIKPDISSMPEIGSSRDQDRLQIPASLVFSPMTVTPANQTVEVGREPPILRPPMPPAERALLERAAAVRAAEREIHSRLLRGGLFTAISYIISSRQTSNPISHLHAVEFGGLFDDLVSAMGGNTNVLKPTPSLHSGTHTTPKKGNATDRSVAPSYRPEGNREVEARGTTNNQGGRLIKLDMPVSGGGVKTVEMFFLENHTE